MRERGALLLERRGHEARRPDSARVGRGCVRARSTEGLTLITPELVAGTGLDEARAALAAGRMPAELPRLAALRVLGPDEGLALGAWLEVGSSLETVEGLRLLLDVPSWKSAGEEAERRVGALVALAAPVLDMKENWERVRTVLTPPEEWDEIMRRSW